MSTTETYREFKARSVKTHYAQARAVRTGELTPDDLKTMMETGTISYARYSELLMATC